MRNYESDAATYNVMLGCGHGNIRGPKEKLLIEEGIMKRIVALLMAFAIVLSATPFVFAETADSGVNLYWKDLDSAFEPGTTRQVSVVVDNDTDKVVIAVSFKMELSAGLIMRVRAGATLNETSQKYEYNEEINEATTGNIVLVMLLTVSVTASSEKITLTEIVVTYADGTTEELHTVEQAVSVSAAVVAKLDDMGYPSLAEAIAAAKDGETVTVTTDFIEEDISLKLDKSIIIDGCGRLWTGCSTWINI